MRPHNRVFGPGNVRLGQSRNVCRDEWWTELITMAAIKERPKVKIKEGSSDPLELLRYWIEEKWFPSGGTRAQIAAKSNLSPSTIDKLLNGSTSTFSSKGKVVLALADALNLDAAALINDRKLKRISRDKIDQVEKFERLLDSSKSEYIRNIIDSLYAMEFGDSAK